MFKKLNEISPGSLDKESETHHELHDKLHAFESQLREFEESEGKKNLEELKESMPKLKAFIIQHLDAEEAVAIPLMQTKLDVKEAAPLRTFFSTLPQDFRSSPFSLTHEICRAKNLEVLEDGGPS